MAGAGVTFCAVNSSATCLCGPANDSPMPVGDRLHGRAQVAQQVPTICDLHGIRRTLPSAVGVGAGAIARDHLNARMRLQPGGKSAGLPIWQQINHGITFEIHQHGAVAPTRRHAQSSTTSKREVAASG